MTIERQTTYLWGLIKGKSTVVEPHDGNRPIIPLQLYDMGIANGYPEWGLTVPDEDTVRVRHYTYYGNSPDRYDQEEIYTCEDINQADIVSKKRWGTQTIFRWRPTQSNFTPVEELRSNILRPDPNLFRYRARRS